MQPASPHGSGDKDDPYFALALAQNAPIWSDENEFAKQRSVRVYSTHELCETIL
jgi:predicted nucleic acid-binding protein